MPIVLAIPAGIALEELLAAAAVWGFRAWRVYRVAKALQDAEDMSKAQEAAKPDAAAGQQTQAQAKADAAVSSDCKNCNEDPDCETARNKVKDALYGAKDDEDGKRGLAERLCHWLHGTDEALRESHRLALKETTQRVENAMDWLTGKKSRPYGRKEGARLKTEAKNKMLNDCVVPEDMKQDTKDLLDYAKEVMDRKTSVSPIPNPNFAAECTKNALGLVKNAFGA